MIPKEKADKSISIVQAQGQEENTKSNKCQQKLDEYHKATETLRAYSKEIGMLADGVRKVSSRKAVN
ncbi:hypothetical protein [Aneurinibacillus danicus]|jgi:hypothetical protein|uniref:Uncharacterized protein n=1 Tax=Aneurinibacillus danicus TaxID=267746 RepID=A0A511V4U2_9BACL|nr:hypothetical protein [Aneurinibacillus danicus]GEN33940.1 hypothetical protein ADA01nite_14000 [Aneurinibacillus danicus]